jgi:hypothetical protein
MERLNELRLELLEINKRLKYPVDLTDYCDLRQRRTAILDEARALASELHLQHLF